METCHNHDTYFWPDEGCPVCRLSEEVTALRAQLAEAEAKALRRAAKACDWGDIYGDNAVKCILALVPKGDEK